MAKSCASKSLKISSTRSLSQKASSLGFMWLKQKCKKEHRFRSIDRNVSYDNEVMAFVEERRMRKLTGVKTKELLIWVSISDIYIDDPSSDPEPLPRIGSGHQS
ncbi:hypothetical protein SO802_001304 [Lithocarpus litseifolius]|uniref:Uncharacterized protein n=1 Tax=Lithocarpus litseifolius TaxID=425828 RepID=A0AAW2DU11_9ROSI